MNLHLGFFLTNSVCYLHFSEAKEWYHLLFPLTGTTTGPSLSFLTYMEVGLSGVYGCLTPPSWIIAIERAVTIADWHNWTSHGSKDKFWTGVSIKFELLRSAVIVN